MILRSFQKGAILALLPALLSAQVVFSRRIYRERARTYQQLWMWNPTDGGLKPLTNSPRNHFQPACSIDGSDVRFLSGTDLYNYNGVWTFDRKTSEERKISGPAQRAVRRLDELAKIAESGSLRYCKSADQLWTCPPGQTFADTLGLYYRAKSQTVDPRTREAVRQTVAAEPVLTLQSLSEKTAGRATLDDLHFLIASGDLYVDLRAAPLVEPARVRVFANAQIGSAFTPIPHQQRETPAITLRSGTALLWDDKQWKILNVGTNLVALLGQDCTVIEVPVTAMEKLIRQRRVNVPEASQASTRQGENSTRILAAATSEDLESASIRVSLVRSHLDGSLGEHPGVSARALRLWVQRYKAAEQACGDGFVGLLPQTRNRGNRTRRLPESTRTLMEISIAEDYETPKQKRRYECWAILKEKCTQEHSCPRQQLLWAIATVSHEFMRSGPG